VLEGEYSPGGNTFIVTKTKQRKVKKHFVGYGEDDYMYDAVREVFYHSKFVRFGTYIDEGPDGTPCVKPDQPRWVDVQVKARQKLKQWAALDVDTKLAKLQRRTRSATFRFKFQRDRKSR